MSGTEGPGHDPGREAFGTACGLAIVVGAVAVVDPALDALAATLVVLGVAGWASSHRRAFGGLSAVGRAPRAFGVAFVALALGAIAFAIPPSTLAPWRALLLGVATVPLWGLERRRAARGPYGGGEP